MQTKVIKSRDGAYNNLEGEIRGLGAISNGPSLLEEQRYALQAQKRSDRLAIKLGPLIGNYSSSNAYIPSRFSVALDYTKTHKSSRQVIQRLDPADESHLFIFILVGLFIGISRGDIV